MRTICAIVLALGVAAASGAQAGEPPSERTGVVALGVPQIPEPLFQLGVEPSVGLRVGLWPSRWIGADVSLLFQPMPPEQAFAPLRQQVLGPGALTNRSAEVLDPFATLAFDLVVAPLSGRFGPVGQHGTGLELLAGLGLGTRMEWIRHVARDGTWSEDVERRRLHTWVSLRLLVGARLVITPRLTLRFDLAASLGGQRVTNTQTERTDGERASPGEVGPCTRFTPGCVRTLRFGFGPQVAGEVWLGKPPAGSHHALVPEHREAVRDRELLEFGLIGAIAGTPLQTAWAALGLRASFLARGIVGVDVAGYEVFESGAPGGLVRGAWQLDDIGASLPADAVPQGYGEAALIVAPLRGFFHLAGTRTGEIALHLRIGTGLVGTIDLDGGRRQACPASSRNPNSGRFVTPDPSCATHQEVHPMVVWGMGARWNLGGLLLRIDLDGTMHPEQFVADGAIQRELRFGARGGVSVGGAIRIR